MNGRLKELCKDILAIVLVIAILALLLMAVPPKTITQSPFLTRILQPFSSFFGIHTTSRYIKPAETGAAAAQPLSITVKNAAGRCSFQNDEEKLDSAYGALGGLLSQALDTAHTPQITSRARMFDALDSVSIAFRFPDALASDALAAWLGAQMSSAGRPAQTYVLCVQNDAVRLYLDGDETTVFETDVPAQSLRALCDSYRPDGSFFAFEADTDAFLRVDAGSLIAPSVSLRAVSASNPCDSRYSTDLAVSLGFNPYGDASYTDDVGNAFFSEPTASLRVSSRGRVFFTNEDSARFAASADTDQARIEAARTLLTQLLGGVKTDGQLYLLRCKTDADQTVCTFDYVINGTRVRRSDGPAATVRFAGTTLISASLSVRAYTLHTETLALLPAKQAAAIVPENTPMLVCYADTDTDSLRAGWSA